MGAGYFYDVEAEEVISPDGTRDKAPLITTPEVLA